MVRLVGFNILLWACLLGFSIQAQVLDVNADGVVGPEEAIVLCEEWKQAAKAINDHQHLSQTWTGSGRPLKLEGTFTEMVVSNPIKLLEEQDKAIFQIPSAPLVLNNHNVNGYGLKISSWGNGIRSSSPGPDLIMTGSSGIISATDDGYENFTLRSNNNIYVYLDYNRDDPHTSGFYVFGRSGYSIVELSEDGDMWLRGTLTEAGLKTKIDHPLDPEHQDLVHFVLETPEMKTLYDGVERLDEKGEAWVNLPEYVKALNGEFRYQLTCLDEYAPVYIARKMESNRFMIAGGKPGMEVCWQVTGIRKDSYAAQQNQLVEQPK